MKLSLQTATRDTNHHQDLNMYRDCPKRELQGSRPPVLKIGKDSCKIKKPQQSTNSVTRKPVVIHLKSPEIIHIKRQDFMETVQELTGKPKPLTTKSSSLSTFTSTSSSTSSRTAIRKDYKTCDGLEMTGDQVMMVNSFHGYGMLPSMAHRSNGSPMFRGLFLPSPNVYTNWYDFGPTNYLT